MTIEEEEESEVFFEQTHYTEEGKSMNGADDRDEQHVSDDVNEDEYEDDEDQDEIFADDDKEAWVEEKADDGRRVAKANRKRMEILLQANNEKDARLEEMQQELHRRNVQHKEGIYWLQLQLDTARREKDAAEERMAELHADLKAMLRIEEDNKVSSGSKQSNEFDADDTEPEKLKMKEKLEQFKTSIGIMENQMTMLKTSSGEVVKTLKEEIADLMEDRSQMELDLLNQLATLDSEKRQSEVDYKQQLKTKDETILRLRAQGGLRLASSSDVDEMEDEINQLRQFKRKAEDVIERERMEADEVIHRLEEDKSRLERRLQVAADDMAMLKSGSGAKEAIKVLDRIAREREAISTSMIRVASVWELADASVLSLEDTLDQLRPYDDTEICGDREKLLSTMESAALVHGQIKVSLLLIELKLRNQLQCLKSDVLTTGWAAPSDHEVERNMQEIQKNALTALSQVEAAMSVQMRQLEETALRETAEMKELLQQRVNKLAELQKHYKDLEAEVSTLKTSNSDSDCVAGARASQAGKPPISEAVLSQLRTEILRIIELIQFKNLTISSLKDEVELYKSREQNLRKELKRALRAANAAENGRRSGHEAEAKPDGIEKRQTNNTLSVAGSPLEDHNQAANRVLSDFCTPKKKHVKAREIEAGNINTGQDPNSESPIHTPTSGMTPLQPSRREISRQRRAPHSPPFVKTSPLAGKSPTGVVDD